MQVLSQAVLKLQPKKAVPFDGIFPESTPNQTGDFWVYETLNSKDTDCGKCGDCGKCVDCGCG